MIQNTITEEIRLGCRLRPAKRMGLRIAHLLLQERLSAENQIYLRDLLIALLLRLDKGQKI